MFILSIVCIFSQSIFCCKFIFIFILITSQSIIYFLFLITFWSAVEVCGSIPARCFFFFFLKFDFTPVVFHFNFNCLNIVLRILIIFLSFKIYTVHKNKYDIFLVNKREFIYG